MCYNYLCGDYKMVFFLSKRFTVFYYFISFKSAWLKKTMDNCVNVVLKVERKFFEVENGVTSRKDSLSFAFSLTPPA